MLLELALATMTTTDTSTIRTTAALRRPSAIETPDTCRARDLLRLAIERGVPLFNAGQHAACAAVYEVACEALLGLGEGELGAEPAARLTRALAAARGIAEPFERSWALRRALDQVDDVLVTHEAPAGEDDLHVVFDFESADAPRWFTLNDDVMGGISNSSFAFGDEGVGVFEGALSLDNNGGFATIRSPETDLDLAGTRGVRVRIRGDGRTYGLSALRSDRRGELGAWRKQFPTVAGTWVEVEVPYEDMVLNVMGRSFPDAGPIEPEQIRSFSFIIADKNEAPFRLEIDWIRAFR